jgi:hypothetical protein
MAFAVGDEMGIWLATKSYAASALYTTLVAPQERGGLLVVEEFVREYRKHPWRARTSSLKLEEK